jgi:hypothetical protein
MKEADTALLEAAGWTIECLSPLELRHAETGSFATKLAANAVVESLRTIEEDERASSQTSLEEKLAEGISDILGWVQAAQATNTEKGWELVYRLIFSDNGARKIAALCTPLGIPLDYYDPNTSFQEDALAYAKALIALVTTYRANFPVLDSVKFRF